jgi:hypothetical protein
MGMATPSRTAATANSVSTSCACSVAAEGVVHCPDEEKMAPAVAGRFELVSGRERVYRKPYNVRERRND